jgi:hypothetical protein
MQAEDTRRDCGEYGDQSTTEARFTATSSASLSASARLAVHPAASSTTNTGGAAPADPGSAREDRAAGYNCGLGRRRQMPGRLGFSGPRDADRCKRDPNCGCERADPRGDRLATSRSRTLLVGCLRDGARHRQRQLVGDVPAAHGSPAHEVDTLTNGLSPLQLAGHGTPSHGR